MEGGVIISTRVPVAVLRGLQGSSGEEDILTRATLSLEGGTSNTFYLLSDDRKSTYMLYMTTATRSDPRIRRNL